MAEEEANRYPYRQQPGESDRQYSWRIDDTLKEHRGLVVKVIREKVWKVRKEKEEELLNDLETHLATKSLPEFDRESGVQLSTYVYRCVSNKLNDAWRSEAAPTHALLTQAEEVDADRVAASQDDPAIESLAADIIARPEAYGLQFGMEEEEKIVAVRRYIRKHGFELASSPEKTWSKIDLPEVRRTPRGNIIWSPELKEATNELYRRGVRIADIAEWVGVRLTAAHRLIEAKGMWGPRPPLKQRHKTTVTPKPARYNSGRRRNSKMTEEVVLEMRKMAKDGQPATSIARHFGISVHTTREAVRGKTWSHLPGAIRQLGRGTKGLTAQDKEAIQKLHKDGVPTRRIAEQFNVSVTRIRQITRDPNAPKKKAPSRKKLTKEMVRDIRIRATAGESYTAIARDMGTGYATVVNAATGASWAHLPGAVHGTVRRRSLSQKQKEEIVRLRLKGVTAKAIAEKVGCSLGAVESHCRHAGCNPNRRKKDF